MPAQRRRRFMDEWKLPEQDADIITSDRAQADLFEAAVALYNEPRKIANYMTGPMLREINQTGVELKDSALKPEALAELAKIVDGGLISAKIAQDIFSEVYANGVMPEAYVREKGLVQVSDTSAIDAAVAEVIAENPAEAEAYKGGKTKLISFFVGHVERSTEYAMEQMFFVIDSRYRSRRPMIITTNLKLAELKNPPDLAHARIYDRILERCAPILFAGKNFREENAGAIKRAAKDIVNRKHE